MLHEGARRRSSGYFNQQLRWKRSNIVDFIVGLTHAWKLHPLLCLQYLSMLLLLLVYPFVIITHLAGGPVLRSSRCSTSC